MMSQRAEFSARASSVIFLNNLKTVQRCLIHQDVFHPDRSLLIPLIQHLNFVSKMSLKKLVFGCEETLGDHSSVHSVCSSGPTMA